MDLTISNKPAYVVRTACPGKHRTVALSYFYMNGPDYGEVLENGIPDSYAAMLPFLCEDVMNDAGLYVETNMRSGEELEDVQTEDEMFALVDKVTYFQIYRPNPQFDVRSEEVGIRPHWNTAYLLDDNNADEIYSKVREDIEKIGSMSRKELQDACKYWESVFTVVANCNKKTLGVRFFEDNDRVFVFTPSK